MSDAVDRALALTKLSASVQPDAEPRLEKDELEAILDATRRAQTWEANKDLTTGTYVQPTVRNGLKYMVVKSGNTGDVEPTWPTRPAQWSGVPGARQITSGTVTFEEAGDEFKNVYNLRAAKREAWSQKMAKASQYPQTAGVDMSVIFEHCKAMRDSYESVLIG